MAIGSCWVEVTPHTPQLPRESRLAVTVLLRTFDLLPERAGHMQL